STRSMIPRSSAPRHPRLSRSNAQIRGLFRPLPTKPDQSRPPMPIQILMPAPSPTMEEGKLAKWLVKEGDKIKPGAVVAEIETDKATMEVEAVDEGTIARILVPAGTDKVKVNAPIAILQLEGESASAVAAASATISPPPQPAPASPAAAATVAGAAMAATPSPQATPLRTAPATAATPAPQMNGHGPRVFASPLAHRLAKANGIDVAM